MAKRKSFDGHDVQGRTECPHVCWKGFYHYGNIGECAIELWSIEGRRTTKEICRRGADLPGVPKVDELDCTIVGHEYKVFRLEIQVCNAATVAVQDPLHHLAKVQQPQRSIRRTTIHQSIQYISTRLLKNEEVVVAADRVCRWEEADDIHGALHLLEHTSLMNDCGMVYGLSAKLDRQLFALEVSIAKGDTEATLAKILRASISLVRRWQRWRGHSSRPEPEFSRAIHDLFMRSAGIAGNVCVPRAVEARRRARSWERLARRGRSSARSRAGVCRRHKFGMIAGRCAGALPRCLRSSLVLTPEGRSIRAVDVT